MSLTIKGKIFYIAIKNVWLGLIVFSLAILSVLIPQLYDTQNVEAVGTLEVGASHTYQTIAAALAASVEGDTIRVYSDYDPTGENYPITVPTSSITIDCHNEATIASTTFAGNYDNFTSAIKLSNSSTLQNCQLNNVMITTAFGGSDNVLITGNTSVTSTATTTIFLLNSVTGWTISNNTGMKQIGYSGTMTMDNLTIQNNEIYSRYVDMSNRGIIDLPTTNNALITSNTLYWTDFGGDAIQFGTSTNMSITSNTLNTSLGSGDGGVMISAFQVTHTNVLVSGNYFTIPAGTRGFYGNSNSVSWPFTDISLTYQYNTCNVLSDEDGNYTACLSLRTAGANNDVFVTSTNNLFYSSSGSSMGGGEYFERADGNFTAYIANNAYYNLDLNTTTSGTIAFVNGGGHQTPTAGPWFKTGDTSTANDQHLAPHSLYCDYDVGAFACTRLTDTPIVVTDDGVVDYANIYAEDMSTALTNSLKPGDTVSLSNGTYSPFTIATSSVTIDGSGVNTIISAGSGQNGITLSSADNSTIQDLVVQNASSTGVSPYIMSYSPLAIGETAYDAAAYGGFVLLHYDGAGCQQDVHLTSFTSATDVTSYDEFGVDNINVALFDSGGVKMMMWVPDSVASTEGAWESICSIAVDSWASDVFTLSNGVYSYNADALANASVPITGVAGGYTNPPTLSGGSSVVYSNIKLINSNSNTIQNVTTTDGYYGIWFNGTSASNNVSSTVFSSSDAYDIYSDATTDNNLKNVTFTSASSSIASTGNVNVYFKARGLATSTSSGLADIGMTFADGSGGSQSETVTSTAGGYTPYTDYLLSWIMTSSSIDTDNGNRNPFTVSFAGDGTYSASSTSNFTLDSPNKTATLVLAAVPSNTAPTASDAVISGTLRVGETLTGTYTFTDTDDDLESGSTYRWLVADTSGGVYSVIAGATTTTTIVSSSHAGKYLKFEVTPDDGTDAGTAATSSASAILSTVPAVTVSESTQAVTEGGTTDTYTVVLTTKPSTNVTITPSVTTGASVSPSTITFTSANWDTTQTVTVTATDNSTVDGSHSSTITHTAVSDDTDYDGATIASVTVTITDNDTSGGGSSAVPSAPSTPVSSAPTTLSITISPHTPTSVSVGNATHTITASSPDAVGDVTVTVQSDPITITLKAGEEQLVDTNKDGTDDLFVRLASADSKQVKLTLSAIVDLEMSINKALSKTNSQNVTLYLNSPDATQMAISNSNDFTNISFEPYSKTKSWILTSGNGVKTVYVKFRTTAGGTKIVSDTIEFVSQATEQKTGVCPLDIGKAYKIPDSSAIYYITEDCTRRAFKDETTYKTYFTSWSSVNNTTQTKLNLVPNDSLGFMPKGPLYNPQYGAIVKIVSDPKIYLLLGTQKYWITSPAVFEALHYAWNWIEDISTQLLDKYTTAQEINYTTHHPDYTLIKYANSPHIYRIEPNPQDQTSQVKRLIKDELIFTSLDFRWDRIVTVPDTEIYEEGEILK